VSLRDEAVVASGRPGYRSKIHRILETLDGEERDEVIALVWDPDPEIRATGVARVLTRHYGHLVGPVTDNQVTEHRNNQPRPE
jgi:hypothetical protein